MLRDLRTCWLETQRCHLCSFACTDWIFYVFQKQIAEVLSRILVKRTTTKDELINSLYKIKEDLKKGLNCRLIIIDSLPPLFTNTDDYNVENNIFLNQIVCIMYFLANECHVVLVVVNLLTTWTEGGFEEMETMEKVACGKYWGSIPHHRLKMERIDQEKSRISLLKSCQFALDKDCEVVIAEGGLVWTNINNVFLNEQSV